MRNKVLQWNKDYAKPTPSEIKAEIKRLQNLLISHKALEAVCRFTEYRLLIRCCGIILMHELVQTVDENTFHAVLPQDTNTGDEGLHDKYKVAYNESNDRNKTLLSDLEAGRDAIMSTIVALGPLKEAQDAWRRKTLKANRKAVGEMKEAEKAEVKRYLEARIEVIEREIE